MASLHPNANAIFSPPLQQDSISESMTLSAKRKRDDINEINHHANALFNVKGSELSAIASTEDAQASIQDLIDILKE
jgi:ribosome-associated translation inhibitor RaiA